MILDPSKSKDRELFYQIGKAVRENYNSSIALLWKDNENLEEISGIEERQLKVFAKGGGRVGVFMLSDTLGGIGWYECSEDDTLSKELLSWAVSQLRAMGATSIVGPINGSTWYNYRFNLSSSDPMFIGEPHQPHYYVKQWEQFGFEVCENYETNVSELTGNGIPDLAELKTNFHERGLSLEKFTAELNAKHSDGFYELVTSSFKKNKMYSSVSREDYARISSDYPKVLDQEHSFVAFDDDKPLGFVGCIQDSLRSYYLKANAEQTIYKQPKLIIKTLVVHPNWQLQGVGALLVKASMRSAIDDGIHTVVHALMHEDNLSAIGGKRMFAASSKCKYALYKLKVDEDQCSCLF